MIGGNVFDFFMRVKPAPESFLGVDWLYGYNAAEAYRFIVGSVECIVVDRMRDVNNTCYGRTAGPHHDIIREMMFSVMEGLVYDVY